MQQMQQVKSDALLQSNILSKTDLRLSVVSMHF